MAESEENNSSGDAATGRIEQILCQPCSRKDTKTTADVFCSDCDEFQCSKCSKAHTLYMCMKNHKFVNASDVKSKKSSFEMQQKEICDKHRKLVKFFCEDENKICCSTCVIVYHRKCHSIVEVQDNACKSQSAGSNLKRKLEEINANTSMNANHIDLSEEQVNNDIRAIFVKIKRMRDDVNKMFDDLEVYVTRETDAFQAEVTNEFAKKQLIGGKHIADGTKALEIVDTALQNGTQSKKRRKQANVPYRDMDNDCQNLATSTISFKFDKTLQLPPFPISDYVPGKLTLNYTLPEGQKCVAPVDSVVELTEIISIDLMQTWDDVKEPLYTGLDFLPDGRLVAVDNQNKKCLIYNEKLEKVGSYQLSYWPQGVVAVSEEQVAITSGGTKIDFLRVSKCNEITLNRTCKVMAQYDSICMKDKRNFVVGTFNGIRPVRIVSLSGEENDFSISFPNKKYSLRTSACNYIKDTEKLILTDMCEHTVYIYDTETNRRVVVKDDLIKEPGGVAVGPLDCILVCSENTNSIVQISKTGRVLSSYQLNMKYPRRVCVSKDKSILAVTNCCNTDRKLQLYKLTGLV